MKTDPSVLPNLSANPGQQPVRFSAQPLVMKAPLSGEDAKTLLSVQVVDTFDGFVALRPEWDALHAVDPEAGFFLSWAWFETAFAAKPGRWRVFVVREVTGQRRVRCILPTKYRVHWSKSQSLFQTEIEAAGRLNHSEYVGFICDPAAEKAALTTLARHLSQMPWVRLSLRYESSAGRAEIFASAFDPSEFKLRWKPYLINKGTTDNLICLRLHLPKDFETWMATKLSANTRQKLRRYLRSYVETGRYRVTYTREDTLERDLDSLFSFWLARWGPTKGPDRARTIALEYREMLREAHRLGALHVSLLWEGDRVLAVLGGIVDRVDRKLHFIMSGRDEADPSPAVGLLIHAANIGWAIENGLRVYDLGHGNQPYKYSFGSDEERVKYLELGRSNTSAMTLDPLCYAEVRRRQRSF